ncbi:bacteriohemerythrin [Anoxynatronum buryatiense]|uniref:Hemerythrin n=1 Tax=Anoxynatronum buryatiense TaxID=489973 RepID=A0AA45WSG5_9CLOT|nr:bacteriohemerythrin [Anoxynatronum buryatiense]SMP38035.1 hemerythrin [Anoxynatronum buryatiense]
MFRWDEVFSCKIARFDEQHRQLFLLANTLLDIIKSDQNADHYDEIVAALNALKDYTVHHFHAEESLMEQYGYPKLMSHRMQHKRFLAKVQEMLDQDVDQNQAEVSMELLTFLADWIQKHIMEVDSQYGAYLNDKGIY